MMMPCSFYHTFTNDMDFVNKAYAEILAYLCLLYIMNSVQKITLALIFRVRYAKKSVIGVGMQYSVTRATIGIMLTACT